MDSDRNDELMVKIGRIARANPHKAFVQDQKRRIKELKEIRIAQVQGKNVDNEVAVVVKSLRESGIIDRHGKLSSRYKIIGKE